MYVIDKVYLIINAIDSYNKITDYNYYTDSIVIGHDTNSRCGPQTNNYTFA